MSKSKKSPADSEAGVILTIRFMESFRDFDALHCSGARNLEKMLLTQRRAGVSPAPVGKADDGFAFSFIRKRSLDRRDAGPTCRKRCSAF